MKREEPPLYVAYPLEVAAERLKEAGFQVKVIKTLPPGYAESGSAVYRVIRQRLNHSNAVELTVTTDPVKRG